jgi:hypothetical protein
MLARGRVRGTRLAKGLRSEELPTQLPTHECTFGT